MAPGKLIVMTLTVTMQKKGRNPSHYFENVKVIIFSCSQMLQHGELNNCTKTTYTIVNFI